MITPAQYCISGGNVGGGLGNSLSHELGLNVNLSTRENTFVCLVAEGVDEEHAVKKEEEVDGSFSFSLPRPVAEAKTFKIGCVSFVLDALEGPDLFRVAA
jgi:hypothetical protein